MARLDSWLSPHLMDAAGWALIHSLWQCLAVAALAAAGMAFCRRPSSRYLVAAGALALALAGPVGTFLVLARAAPPVQLVIPADSRSFVSVAPPASSAMPSDVGNNGGGLTHPSVMIGVERTQQHFFPHALAWLVAAWLCGVVFFSLRFAGGVLLLEHRGRRRSSRAAPRILALCQEVQRHLGLHRAILYLECAWLQTPAVIGWLRPVVFLPLSVVTGLSEAQLRAVIAHELAHIRRHDWLVNLFQILVETLLFYHPAIWWLNRRMRDERELACDEIAVSLADNRLDYAKALTLMAEWEKAPALAMAANRGLLSQRVWHILGRKRIGTGQRMLGLTGSAIFLATALGAANALFGIAYPVAAAHAKPTMKTVLSSGQTGVGRVALPVNQKDALAAGSAAPNQAGSKDTISRQRVRPVQIKVGQAKKILVPSVDLPAPLLNENPPAPTLVASTSAAMPSDQIAAPEQSSKSSSAPAPNSSASAAPLAGQAVGNGPNAAIAAVTQCRNSSVFGQVVTAKAIRMQGFTCLRDGNGSTASSAGDLAFGGCPLASTNSAHQAGCKWDVQLNVQLADPKDAAKMQPGKLVRLGGDFSHTRQSQTDYLTVTNARVLFTDSFWKGAPVAMTCSAPEVADLSRKTGGNLCVQNEILAALNVKRPALEAAALLAKPGVVPNPAPGDPDAISCRNSGRNRLNCAYNSFWARPMAEQIYLAPFNSGVDTTCCIGESSAIRIPSP